MKALATDLPGVFDLEIEPHTDERGLFARTYCDEEFAAAGITFDVAQANISRNSAPFTLRGMHWQEPPFAEAKVVRATAGTAYDVVVDLRPGSTHLRWLARILDARLANGVFIPEGCAHGFLTLEPETEISYLMGRGFVPGLARGFRWDDPAVGIQWPREPVVISEGDRGWPALRS